MTSEEWDKETERLIKEIKTKHQQEIGMSGLPEWSIHHIPFSSEDWDSYYTNRKRVCGLDQHKWVDTGMRKTFCKICDTAAYLDPMTGHVEIIPDTEEKK